MCCSKLTIKIKEKPDNNVIIGDHLHCCPQGNVCNMQERKCEGPLSIPWFTKKAAVRTQQSSVFFNFKFRNKCFFFSYFKELTQIINKKEINISPLNLLSKSNNTQIICPDATSKILQLIY